MLMNLDWKGKCKWHLNCPKWPWKSSLIFKYEMEKNGFLLNDGYKGMNISYVSFTKSKDEHY